MVPDVRPVPTVGHRCRPWYAPGRRRPGRPLLLGPAEGVITFTHKVVEGHARAARGPDGRDVGHDKLARRGIERETWTEIVSSRKSE